MAGSSSAAAAAAVAAGQAAWPDEEDIALRQQLTIVYGLYKSSGGAVSEDWVWLEISRQMLDQGFFNRGAEDCRQHVAHLLGWPAPPVRASLVAAQTTAAANLAAAQTPANLAAATTPAPAHLAAAAASTPMPAGKLKRRLKRGPKRDSDIHGVPAGVGVHGAGPSGPSSPPLLGVPAIPVPVPVPAGGGVSAADARALIAAVVDHMNSSKRLHAAIYKLLLHAGSGTVHHHDHGEQEQEQEAVQRQDQEGQQRQDDHGGGAGAIYDDEVQFLSNILNSFSDQPQYPLGEM